MVLIIAGAILISESKSPVNNSKKYTDNYHKCGVEDIYKVRTVDVNIRRLPGKYNDNPPLHTLKRREQTCFTQKIYLHTEQSGKKTPWISIKTVDPPQVEGWVNRCLLEGKSIGFSYESYC